MEHSSSSDDKDFKQRFETCRVPAAEFDHLGHVRLAYVYLVENDVESAYKRMREALYRLLNHLGVDTAKYHDTMTRAWILAVRHFMKKTSACESADELIDANPMILDTSIMKTHYSAQLLNSVAARQRFVEPDLEPIPRYDN